MKADSQLGNIIRKNSVCDVSSVRRSIVLFLLGAIAIISFNHWYIDDDYIVQFPYADVSTETMAVTAGHPASVEFAAEKDSIYGFNLYYTKAENGDGYTTRFQLLHSGTELYSAVLDNASGYEDQQVQLKVPEGLLLQEGADYEIWLTSDAATEENSLIFHKNYQKDEICVRVFYRWFSRSFVIRICSVGELLLLAAVCAITKRRNASPECVFLFTSILLCLCWCVLMPSFRVPNEDSHFVRIFGILEGYFVVPADGRVPIPQIAVAWQQYTPYNMWKHLETANYGADRRLWDCVNIALYNPLVYIFQLVGVFIGSLSGNVWISCLTGRLISAIGCSVMIYYAIKWIPYGKWALAVISLCPVALQERASLFADAMTYAAVVLLLAYCMKLGVQKENSIGWKQLLPLTVMVLMVSSSKVVYFMAAFLVFLIPGDRFSGKRLGRCYKIVTVITAVVLAVGWAAYAGRYLSLTNGGGNSAEKIQWVMHHPLSYIGLMLHTLWKYGALWTTQLTGETLGYPMPFTAGDTLTLIGVVALLVALFCGAGIKGTADGVWQRDRACDGRTRENRFLLAFVFLMTVILIMSSLYVQWTKGNPEEIEAIEGIQGRYFLPMLPVLYFMLADGLNEEELSYKVQARCTVISLIQNIAVLTCVLMSSSFT